MTDDDKRLHMEDAIIRITSPIEEVMRIIFRIAIKGGCDTGTRDKAVYLLRDAANQIENRLPLLDGE